MHMSCYITLYCSYFDDQISYICNYCSVNCTSSCPPVVIVKEKISKNSTWQVVCGHAIYTRGEWFMESLHFTESFYCYTRMERGYYSLTVSRTQLHYHSNIPTSRIFQPVLWIWNDCYRIRIPIRILLFRWFRIQILIQFRILHEFFIIFLI